jgi:hypothetical protein
VNVCVYGSFVTQDAFRGYCLSSAVCNCVCVLVKIGGDWGGFYKNIFHENTVKIAQINIF